MSNAAKGFDILTISFWALCDYFDDSNKIVFKSVSVCSKTVLS